MTTPAPHSGPETTRSMMKRPIDVAAEPDGPIVKRGGLAFVGVALQGAVRFLASFLVGRFTSPASLATVSSGLSLANILSLAWPTSAGGAASRFIARARGEGEHGDPRAVARFLGLRTMQSVLVLGIAAVPGWMILGGSLAESLIISTLVAGYSGYAFTRGVHFGAGQAGRQVRWDLLTSSLGILGVLVVLGLGLPPVFVLLSLGLAYLLYTVACWPWGATGHLPKKARREMDVFVAWASLGTLASAGFVQFAMVVAVVVAGRHEAGAFAAAMTLAAPAAMVANSLATVLFPSMAEALGRGDQQSLERQLDRSTRILTALIVVIFGVLVVGARPLVALVWGSQYEDAAVLIPLLLVPGLLRSVASPSQGAISTASSGGVVFSSAASVGGFVLGSSVWLVMPDSWGVIGVAAGYALGTCVIAVAILGKAWSDHHQSWAGLSSRLVIAVVVMSALSLTLSENRLPLGYDALAALAFAAGWLVWVRDDAWTVVGLLKRRSSS